MNYEILADEVLLRMLKNSDEKAFEAIFNRYWKKIFLSAYKKVKDKSLAEDLTQNLFGALWDKRNVYNIDHLFRYLSVGIKNRVINHIDAEIVKSNLSGTAEIAEQASADNQLLLKDLQFTIQEAISHLPEKTRMIFKLSRFEKYSVKELARQFDITEKAVEYHITQSNKILRLYLKDFLVFNTWLLLLIAI